MFRIQFLFLTSFIIGVFSHERPVIGIFTIPSEIEDYSATDFSFFPASYVKQLEDAGAQVIPISWEATYVELSYLMSKINGLFFTGGESGFNITENSPGYTYNKFTDAASYLILEAIKQNNVGNVFPIMGTCQGFQLVQYIISKYQPILSSVAGQVGVHKLLTITSPYSEMFFYMSAMMKLFIQQYSGPYFSHKYGILPSTYETNPDLKSFFTITALSDDKNMMKFIAAAEAKQYPFFLYQFHSEKHQFEWTSLADHDPRKIQMAQHFTAEFLKYARKNNNVFPINELNARIIYNYSPINTMKQDSKWVQVYVFLRPTNILMDNEELLGINGILDLGSFNKEQIEY